MSRLVEILIRVDNRTAIRSMREFALASQQASRTAGESWRKTGSAMQGVGRVMTTIGAAAGAFGYEAVKSSMNFQTAMTRIQTQAQVSGKTVAQMGQAVLKLGSSGQVQYGPTQLANALYHIESVAVGNTVPGLHKVSTAMAILKTAAMGAAVGGSDLEQTTTALMGAMAAMHAPASQAGSVMALLNSTVGAGNMRMQDLVTALGKGVIPAFRNVGMTAKDAFAAIALAADQGTQAGSAAAQLATALHYLADPTTKASRLFSRLGLDSNKFAQDVYGPGGMLRGLRDVQNVLAGLPGYQRAQAIFTLMPAGRGRVLQQVLNNLTQYGNKLQAITPDVNQLNKAYGVQQQTLQGQLHTAWAQISTDMTKFGNTLIPLIEKYLPLIMKYLGEFFKWLTHLSPELKKFIAIATVGFAVGGPLLYGMGTLVSLVGKLKAAYAALTPVARGAAAAEAEAAGAGGAGAAGAGGALGLGARGGAVGIAAAVAGLLGYNALNKRHKKEVRGDIGALYGLLGIKNLGGALNQALSGHPIGFLAAMAHTGISNVVLKGWNALTGARGGLVTPHGIRHMQSGGPIGSDNVPAWLSAGEGIVSRAGMSSLGLGGLAALNNGGYGGANMTISPSPAYFMVDGRVLARAVIQYTLNRAARGPSSLIGGSLATGTTAAAVS